MKGLGSSASFATLVSFISLYACGHASKPAPVAPAPAATTTATARSSEALKQPTPEPPKLRAAKSTAVKLLDAGAAPRRKLRYTFKAGTTEYAALVSKMVLSIAIDNHAPPKPEELAVEISLRIDAKEVTPEGDAKLTFNTERVALFDDAKTALPFVNTLAELNGLFGLNWHATLSPRGITREAGFDLPQDGTPTVQAQMNRVRDAVRDLYVPLPEEEIGRGGRWQVLSQLPLGSLDYSEGLGSGAAMLDKAATYTLEALAEGSAQIKAESVLSSEPNQQLEVGNIANLTRVLDELEGASNARLSLSFVNLVSSGSSKVSTSVRSTAMTENDRVTAKVSSDVSTTVKPGRAPATKKK